MVGMIGPNELLIILLIAFILFGANKLPELARSLGRATGEFRKAQKEAEIELRKFEEDLRAGRYKTQDEKRKKLEEIARTLNIDPEGKSDEELIDEINKALPKEKVEP